MNRTVKGGLIYGDFPNFIPADNTDDIEDINNNFAGRNITTYIPHS